jgi:autotransporter-associated beta strand protein
MISKCIGLASRMGFSRPARKRIGKLGDAPVVPTSGATIALLSGGVTLTADSTLSSTATGLTVSGVISGGSGIAKQCTGTVTLTANNTYTGQTTISAGTLALNSSGSIAASSGLVDNGTFDISAATSVAQSSVAVTGTQPAAAATASGATIKTLSGTGTVALGGKTLELSDAAGSFSGSINGSGGVTLTAGTENLSGSNGYTGTTTIGSGTLGVSGPSSATSTINILSGTLSFIGAGNDLLANGTAVNMDTGTYWDLGGTTQHVAALSPSSYADNIHVHNGTLVVSGSVFNLIGSVSGSIQGAVIASEDAERSRAFSTDSQRAKIDAGGTAQLDALAVYPHEGALSVKTPNCAAEFIASRGDCR